MVMTKDYQIEELEADIKTIEDRIEAEKMKVKYGLERMQAVPDNNQILFKFDKKFNNGTYEGRSVPFPRFIIVMGISTMIITVASLLGAKYFSGLPIDGTIENEIISSIILVLSITGAIAVVGSIKRAQKCRFCGNPHYDSQSMACSVCNRAYDFDDMQSAVKICIDTKYQKFKDEIENGGIAIESDRCKKCRLPKNEIDLGLNESKTRYCPEHGTSSRINDEEYLEILEKQLRDLQFLNNLDKRKK